MEYVYTALLLHKAGKKITEENVKKVLTAAGVKSDDARVKTLVAALKEVDIEEAISKSVAMAAPAPVETEKTKEEEPEEEEEKKISEEEAVSGLSALFG